MILDNSARNFAEPMKWSKGTMRVDIARRPKNSPDQRSIPLPMERYRIQPTNKATNGRFLLVNKDSLAFRISSE